MRRFVTVCSAIALVACGGGDDRADAADSTSAGPAPISLSAVAGRWSVQGFNEAGDSLVRYVLTATATTTGWTIVLPGRGDTIPVHVVVAGSAVTLHAGPYESVLRRGVQVQTEGTARLVGDSLVGTTIAHYSTTGADSVLRVRTVGTRIP